jgi:hypothetical protein
MRMERTTWVTEKICESRRQSFVADRLIANTVLF